MLVILILGILLAACTAEPAATDLPIDTSEVPAKSGTIHVAVRGSPNVKDLPFLDALDLLRAQGYTVEMTALDKGELIAQAIEQGDIHIANVSPSILWVAVSKGADVRTIVGNYNNPFYLVVRKEIESCTDLDGRSLAFSSKQAAGYVLFEDYVAKNCPGIGPQIVLISQSENRVVALQSGEIDGVYIEIEQWMVLENQNAGNFRIILNYGEEYPDYLVSGFCAQRSWAELNPEMVRDFVRALLTSQRALMSDPDRFQAEVAELLDLEPVDAKRITDAYLELGVWDANGALTPENIEYSLNILRESGAVPADTKVEDVADLTYMTAVLDEIGRE